MQFSYAQVMKQWVELMILVMVVIMKWQKQHQFLKEVALYLLMRMTSVNDDDNNSASDDDDGDSDSSDLKNGFVLCGWV